MDITMDIHDILVEKYTIWYIWYYEYTCIFLVNFTAWWSNVIGNSKTGNISQWSLRSNVVVISSRLVQWFTTSKRLASAFRSSGFILHFWRTNYSLDPWKFKKQNIYRAPKRKGSSSNYHPLNSYIKLLGVYPFCSWFFVFSPSPDALAFQGFLPPKLTKIHWNNSGWWHSIWMFPKIMGFPPKSSHFNGVLGFSIIFTIHFGVPGVPLFGGANLFFPPQGLYLGGCWGLQGDDDANDSGIRGATEPRNEELFCLSLCP